MFNKLRANPGMALGAALFIVALIAVIVWIVRRGKKDKEGPSKPEITITGMELKLKPDKSNVEEYMMYEYDTGTVPGTSATVKGSQVATNIDLVLNWTNGTGFATNNVSKLIFKRFVRPVDAAIDDKSGDILVEDSTKHTESTRVGDFQKGEVTISGENLASSYTGGNKITTYQGYKNIIKIYYVDGDGDENLLTETNPIDISKNDLMRTLDIDKVESVTITVSPGDVAALKLAAGNSNMFYKIYSVSGAETPALKLSSVNTTSGNVKFTHNNLTYEFGIDFGTGEDPFFKFEKISTDSDDLFLKVVDGTNANKYVVGTGSGFKLMTFDDIKSTGANFTNSRVRIVGNENVGSISRPSDMTNPVSTMSVSRKYPPKPYPGPGNTNVSAVNKVSWTVSGSDYGNGKYTASIDDSFIQWAPQSFDVEGLVDGYFKGETGNLGVYHTSRAGNDVTFTLTMPQGIALDRVELGNRTEDLVAGYANPTKYVIKGVREDATEEVLITTTATASDNFDQWSIDIPDDKKNEKYKTFKVIFTSVAGKWSVIGNILFYGKENIT